MIINTLSLKKNTYIAYSLFFFHCDEGQRNLPDKIVIYGMKCKVCHSV